MLPCGAFVSYENGAMPYPEVHSVLEMLPNWCMQKHMCDLCQIQSFEIRAGVQQLLHETDFGKRERMVQDSSRCCRLTTIV